MQVYRGLDIGTAKPSPAERQRVPHYLIDLVEPEQPFTVAEFQAEGRRALAELSEREVPPLVVGGSGLHFRALVDPLRFPPTDPEMRARLEDLGHEEARRQLLEVDPLAGRHVDLANPRRVIRALEIQRLTGRTPSSRADRPEARRVREYRAEVPFVAVGLDPGDRLEDRIERRLDRMLAEGLLEEVASLRGRLGPTASQAVGYKELMGVVEGSISLEEGRQAALEATKQVARQQRTYFRRDPRIRWVPWSPDPFDAVREALSEVAAWSS